MILSPILNISHSVKYTGVWSEIVDVEIDYFGLDDWLTLADGRQCYSSWVSEWKK